MSRSGLFPEEEVILSINVTWTPVDRRGYEYESTSGELVLVKDGIVFLKAAGLLKTNRERISEWSLDQIQGIREESKGISMGSLMGKVKLILSAHHRNDSYWNHVFTCSREDCQNFIREVYAVKRIEQALVNFGARLQQLIKPREEISLNVVAKDSDLRENGAIIEGSDKNEIPEDIPMEILREIVSALIADGDLDGVLDGDTYVSNTKLSRKSVQYHVNVDFSTLFSQLKTKGIVLQKIECPSCSGDLSFPEEGSSIVCKYCSSTVHATDIFEKFKSLL